MKILLIRLQAPLMSFGGTSVDNYGVTRPFPGRSLLTGLLANALGWTHGEHEKLERLQARLRFASRCDQTGTPLRDYQTVDLGQAFMREGWTTWGSPEGRGGGQAARTGTHIRYRDYWADRIQLVALTLEPATEEPTLEAIHKALETPARPLFIGRKACLPSAPLAHGWVTAEHLEAALEEAPRLVDDSRPITMWSERVGEARGPVQDHRDWRGQVHIGEAWVGARRISPPAKERSNA